MKIYYNNESDNIYIEGERRYFAKKSLIAVPNGNYIYIRYKDCVLNELYLHHQTVRDINNNTIQGGVQNVVDYLNIEFNKGGKVQGEGVFNGLDYTVSVSDARLIDGCLVFVTPKGLNINDYCYSTVISNSSFDVNRKQLDKLKPLTANLEFYWCML